MGGCPCARLSERRRREFARNPPTEAERVRSLFRKPRPSRRNHSFDFSDSTMSILAIFPRMDTMAATLKTIVSTKETTKLGG